MRSSSCHLGATATRTATARCLPVRSPRTSPRRRPSSATARPRAAPARRSSRRSTPAASSPSTAGPIRSRSSSPRSRSSTTAARGDGSVTIDGGGKVTLSGGGANRILYQNTCDQALHYTTSHCKAQHAPHLVIQNIGPRGREARTRPNHVLGGGAMFVGGGTFKAYNVRFANSTQPNLEQDYAGGAIYTFNQATQPVYVVSSTFDNNSGCNGGALGSIGTSWTILEQRLLEQQDARQRRESGEAEHTGRWARRRDLQRRQRLHAHHLRHAVHEQHRGRARLGHDLRGRRQSEGRPRHRPVDVHRQQQRRQRAVVDAIRASTSKRGQAGQRRRHDHRDDVPVGQRLRI